MMFLTDHSRPHPSCLVAGPPSRSLLLEVPCKEADVGFPEELVVNEVWWGHLDTPNAPPTPLAPVAHPPTAQPASRPVPVVSGHRPPPRVQYPPWQPQPQQQHPPADARWGGEPPARDYRWGGGHHAPPSQPPPMQTYDYGERGEGGGPGQGYEYGEYAGETRGGRGGAQPYDYSGERGGGGGGAGVGGGGMMRLIGKGTW
jgi:hypothetical protein